MRSRPKSSQLGLIWGGVGLAVLLVIVLVALFASGVLGGSSPDEAVAQATDDVRDWKGITYRGRVTQYSKGDAEVDVTVNRDGDKRGTLTRSNGGRAEYASVGGVELLKADAKWFADDTQQEQKTQHLAGIWVKNPLVETSGLNTTLSPPQKVAASLGVPGVTSISMFNESGTQNVDGTEGRVLEGISRRLVVSEESSPRLLAFEPFGSTSGQLLRVARPDEAALGPIGELRSIADAAPDYSVALYEKAKVSVELLNPNGGGLCTTPECTVVVRLRNTSRFDTKGSLQVTLNDLIVDYKSFRLAAGQQTEFTVSERNPGEADPGNRVPLRWNAGVTTY